MLRLDLYDDMKLIDYCAYLKKLSYLLHDGFFIKHVYHLFFIYINLKLILFIQEKNDVGFRSTKWITGFTLYNFCFFSQIAIYKKRQLIKEKLKQQKLLLKEKNRLKRLSKKKK